VEGRHSGLGKLKNPNTHLVTYHYIPHLRTLNPGHGAQYFDKQKIVIQLRVDIKQPCAIYGQSLGDVPC
jgi:hypothetical protein